MQRRAARHGELTTADGSPRVIFAFEGGRWLWPAVRVGHVWSVGAASLETLSVRPAVFSVRDFLTREEAAHIRRVTQPLLRRSGAARERLPFLAVVAACNGRPPLGPHLLLL